MQIMSIVIAFNEYGFKKPSEKQYGFLIFN